MTYFIYFLTRLWGWVRLQGLVRRHVGGGGELQRLVQDRSQRSRLLGTKSQAIRLHSSLI